MRGKWAFVAGIAAGYVLGTKAGRERYEQLAATARKFTQNPTVQETAGLVQAQANKLVDKGKDLVGDKLDGTRFSRFVGRDEPVVEEVVVGIVPAPAAAPQAKNVTSPNKPTRSQN